MFQSWSRHCESQMSSLDRPNTKAPFDFSCCMLDFFFEMGTHTEYEDALKI